MNRDETIFFIEQSFRNGEIKRYGTDIVKILPPIPMFGKNNAAYREMKKKNVINKLQDFFEKYYRL